MPKSLWDIIMSEEDGPDIFDYSNDTLASMESWGIRQLGLGDVFSYADQQPLKMGYKGESRGEADAMRHLLLSGELHRSHPTMAGPLLMGHEWVTNVLQGQRSDDREMDLHNNAIGQDIGRLAKSRDEVEVMAKEAIANGRAKILQQTKFGEY